MTDEDCGRMALLIQAELDGELDASEAADLHRHLATCTNCAAQAEAMRGLSARLQALPVETAPASLRTAVLHDLALEHPARARAFAWPRLRPTAFGFASGLVAASLVVALIPRGAEGPVQELVGSHIRALQPGHLTDVISTDRHTVKPWFDGRIDYAPPVRDLAAAGFPLIGGRLDYLGGRPVAAMAYGRAQHVIDLYVWPGPAVTAASGTRQGYNWRSWSQSGMTIQAVSDVEANELAAFERAWRDAG